MGSGEGALSGDSYYGDGVYRSTDGGVTWTHVSDPLHRAGRLGHRRRPDERRTTCTPRPCAAAAATTAPPRRAAAATASRSRPTAGRPGPLRKGTTDELARSDRPRDGPAEPQGPLGLVLGRRHLPVRPTAARPGRRALGDLPAGNFLEGGTRFSLGISHPAGAANATVYTGFDYFDLTRPLPPVPGLQDRRRRRDLDPDRHRRRGSDSDTILDYCGTQCFYDNVVKPDPTNPNVVYVVGSYGYNNSPQSRRHLPLPRRRRRPGRTSGYDLHPDFHAFAFEPERHPAHRHRQRRRRLAVAHRWPAAAPATRCPTADWENLNGTVNPTTGGAGALHRTGDHPVHVVATVPHGPRPVLGRHPGQRHPAQVDGQRPLVRPGQR